jgi:hypothetical protein
MDIKAGLGWDPSLRGRMPDASVNHSTPEGAISSQSLATLPLAMLPHNALGDAKHGISAKGLHSEDPSDTTPPCAGGALDEQR